MTAPRYAALDYIRGFALLGILIVNAIAFAWPLEVYSNPMRSPLGMSAADKDAWWVIHTFFESKCITLFALLFGISVFLVKRKDQPQTPTGKTILFRRLMWLAVFGVAHGALIWLGDILLMYAICGLVFAYMVRTDKLLTFGSLLYIVGSLMIVGSGWVLIFVPRDQIAELISGSDGFTFAQEMVLMKGDFASSLYGNFVMWATQIVSQIVAFGPKILGLMMLGLGLFRAGYFDSKSKIALHLVMILLGGAALIVMGWQNLIILREGFPEPEIYGSHRAAAEFLSLFTSLGYASALMLIGRIPVANLITQTLEPVGRMAFTNYLSQSLIMTAIFYGGRGFGLYGTMGHAQIIPIVAGIWIGQIVVSHLWLRAFHYGPFEWVWRCLSEARFVPIR
ncbi:DUF418 domain-containing protein [Asticcacaulis sp. BYS171W]|uniref:DUF418 domain-containing protein n=1 Tax=Asticcacaulis aquaticus TaxID=2984212 RepID=A0ABT5HRY0_9CAUL|nr:DUF418 domain-containing protein [Asticcacaulis aquaticus]